MVFHFYVYEYFSFKYVCAPYLDLVSTKVTRRYWIHWNWSCGDWELHVGVGNQTQVHKCPQPLSHDSSISPGSFAGKYTWSYFLQHPSIVSSCLLTSLWKRTSPFWPLYRQSLSSIMWISFEWNQIALKYANNQLLCKYEIISTLFVKQDLNEVYTVWSVPVCQGFSDLSSTTLFLSFARVENSNFLLCLVLLAFLTL